MRNPPAKNQDIFVSLCLKALIIIVSKIFREIDAKIVVLNHVAFFRQNIFSELIDFTD